MGLDNPLHLLFVLLLVLLVFGAKRLPEMGRSLGEGMRGFKESINPHTPPPTSLTAISTPVAGTAPVHHEPADGALAGETVTERVHDARP